MKDLKQTILALKDDCSEGKKAAIRREFFRHLPAEHGLADYVDVGGLATKFAAQAELFLYSCSVLLAETVETAERFAQGEKPDGGLEGWVRETQHAHAFVAFLELAAPWLAEEVDRMLEDIGTEFILRPTCAPNQLLYQWFCEAFRRTLLALGAAGRVERSELAAAVAFQKAAWDLQRSTQIRWAEGQSYQIR